MTTSRNTKHETSLVLAFLAGVLVISAIPFHRAAATTVADGVTWGVDVGDVFFWDMTASAHLNTTGGGPLNATGLWNTTITWLGNGTLGQFGPSGYNPYSLCNATTGWYNTTASHWDSTGGGTISAINITARVAVQADPYFMLLVAPLVGGVLSTMLVNASVMNFCTLIGYTSPSLNKVTANSVSIEFPDGTAWNATYDPNGVATSYYLYYTDAFLNAFGLNGTGQFMERRAVRWWPLPSPALASITPSTDNDGRITLRWSSVASATNYSVYRSTSTITSAAGLAPIVTVMNATGYVDTVNASGTYYYAVVAINASGTSDVSNCEAVVINLTPLNDFATTTIIMVASIATVVVVMIAAIVVEKKRIPSDLAVRPKGRPDGHEEAVYDGFAAAAFGLGLVGLATAVLLLASPAVAVPFGLYHKWLEAITWITGFGSIVLAIGALCHGRAGRKPSAVLFAIAAALGLVLVIYVDFLRPDLAIPGLFIDAAQFISFRTIVATMEACIIGLALVGIIVTAVKIKEEGL
ncbi:MAG: hypothetical protein JW839_11155 [Candidatus Lokiarchaeota archaeon]|nr:hypothetical protein [Candidatus Lokiarchaeota archaeon]